MEKILSGSTFNAMFSGKRIFCKFLKDDLKHHDMQYVENALNVDKNKINPNKYCCDGLYFFELSKFYAFFGSFGDNIVFVTVPDDAKVCFEKDKFKSDKIYISEKVKVNKDFKIDEWLIKNNKIDENINKKEDEKLIKE